jgi:TolA-binding protein
MFLKAHSISALALLSASLCTHAVAQEATNTSPMEQVTAPAPIIAQTAETLSARTLVRLEQISRELVEAIGRIEALEGALASQQSQTERLITLTDMVRSSNENAAQILAEPTAEGVAGTADLAPSAAPLKASTAQADMFIAPAPPPIPANVFLTNAQTALQGGNYTVAEANLTQMIWLYPASPEASEGRWLLGEARYVQTAWGTAAQAYVDYLKVSPQGPRANEALLRLAGVFRQLGDNRQRCVALTEFKRRAPRPDATLKARADAEIARMTCPAT